MQYNEYEYVQPRNSYRNPHDEWKGIHSCKFPSSKLLIHPRAPMVKEHRRVSLMPPPSNEYVFRPSVKKVPVLPELRRNNSCEKIFFIYNPIRDPDKLKYPINYYLDHHYVTNEQKRKNELRQIYKRKEDLDFNLYRQKRQIYKNPHCLKMYKLLANHPVFQNFFNEPYKIELPYHSKKILNQSMDIILSNPDINKLLN